MSDATLESLLSDRIANLEKRLARVDAGEFPVIETAVVGKWVVWWGVFIFITWSLIILYNPKSMSATPLSFVADLFGRNKWGVSFALASSAIAAIIGIYSERSDAVGRTLLFPIVFLMLIASTGSMRAVIIGHYADGVERDWSFIFADQLPWIAASLIYVVALLQQFGRSVKWSHGFQKWRL